MKIVLDQYEVEYRESYISGSYDQVVNGTMFSKLSINGIKKYVFIGNRGVTYGSTYSNLAPVPGTHPTDPSNSFSYSLQPYKEKAGNCRAAKFKCDQERIYDSMTPDHFSCFKINGASPFIFNGNFRNVPGFGSTYGINENQCSFIMFDGHIPSENNTAVENLNVGIDKRWTKSFPFEPRYNITKRQKNIKTFNETRYKIDFLSSTATVMPFKVKRNKLIVSFFGRSNVNRHNKSNNDLNYKSPLSGQWYHYFYSDAPRVNTTGGFAITGSTSNDDLSKILFGYGDIASTFFDSQIIDNNNPTGYALRGSNNLPEFRTKKSPFITTIFTTYELNATGSFWCFNPVIRGWKYGLYSGLPTYTSAYYRQGKFGQFRDMLEQRIDTAVLNENSQDLINYPVVVKFLDQQENLTPPENTQSQNLSQYATSSLPYFDLEQRNRSETNPSSLNLQQLSFILDNNFNINI